MNDLLKDVLDAHGGRDRWHELTQVRFTIVTGGQLWAMKGLVQDPAPREMTVWLHEERASVHPFGAADQRTVFTPDRIAIEKCDGRLVAERADPRSSFAGHELTTPWDALHRAYFNGYALWTYLTTPFLLAMPEVSTMEIPSVREFGQLWRGLRATFPAGIASHSAVQDFYFGADNLLRRHDYHVDVAGGVAATQYVSDYRESGGIRLPTARRAYRRDADRRPVSGQLLVSIDLAEIRFS